jgi:predicted TIM-barrel fold metal-dependent hydrolase
MKIVDAHHHFWDPAPNYHPWLRDEPMIPFRYGDYSSIRGRFMPEDYEAATAGWDVVATVTMEGEWDPADPTGEALWMQRLQDETGRPGAHVAQAWLDRDDLADILKLYQRLPVVRSVRHKPCSNPAPGGDPGGIADPAFRDGFRRLADHGLLLDLQTPWWHLHEAIEMATHAPEVKIVLNHAGLPSDRSPEGLDGWRKAMVDFAALS